LGTWPRGPLLATVLATGRCETVVAMEGRKAVIVALSGASSSGKTTLARLLRDIFPRTFILHEDDFYKHEDELPVKDGLVDWDCPESISVPDMERSLAHIRAAGAFPPGLDSIQDKNAVGDCPISGAKVEAMRAKVQAWLQPGRPGHAFFGVAEMKVCILDGFLLYCPQLESVMDLIDVKLFLLVSRAKVTQRRAARDGYVTLEGFWRDPPGYVDKIVWPNYAGAHKWLFEDGDVEGRLNGGVLSEKGIQAQIGRGLDVDMETTLEWAVDSIIHSLGAFLDEHGKH